MANDRFNKKIILSNKKKVCPLTNTKSDKFFRKIIAFKVLILWLYKKVVLYAISAIFYSNYHFFVTKLPEISLFIKYMIEDSIFNKKLSYTNL